MPKSLLFTCLLAVFVAQSSTGQNTEKIGPIKLNVEDFDMMKIGDNYDDFLIRNDSIYVELGSGNFSQLMIVPTDFFYFLNLQKCDSTHVRLKSISTKEKILFIKCFSDKALNTNGGKILEIIEHIQKW